MARRVVCFLLLAAVLIFPVRTLAATSDEIRDQINELEKEYDENQGRIDKLEQLLSENAEQMADIVAQKNAVDEQISLLFAQLENINAQIRQYADLVATEQENLDIAQERLNELNKAYIARIQTMEKSGSISYWLVLLASRSFVDFLDRINMIREIEEADRKRLEQLETAAEEVEQCKAALTEKKSLLEDARAELLLTRQELEKKREQAEELLRQLVAKGAEYEQLLDEAEAREQDLLDEIAQKENEFDDAKYQEWLATQKPVTGGSDGGSTGGTVNTSGWMTPVPYYTLTSPFGMRDHPILGYPRMHNGVDLACAKDTPIYAAKDGVVSIATWSDTAGNYVRLDHSGGYSSVYMHMTRYVVSAGQYVAQGEIIGYVGNTGLSKGNHLHFGISLNGAYVNPMEYIG